MTVFVHYTDHFSTAPNMTRQGILLIALACGLVISAVALAGEAPTLADLWNGHAILVIDEGRGFFGGNFGMHFLSARWEGNQLLTYYIINYSLNDVPRFATGLALSQDGITFKNQRIVIDIGGALQFDNRIASFPGVWKDGDMWYLVYEGAGTDMGRWPGDIGLATSTDGVTWIKDPGNPILVHQSSGWEQVNIGTPSLWKEGDTWYLFYHGYNGAEVQIGVATGPDLHTLTRYPGNPIIRTGHKGTWDSGTVGKRSIHKEGDYYYMIFEGSTDQPFEMAQWSSGLARSTDLITWEKWLRNPVLPQTTKGFGYDGPEWIETPDGKLHVYFRDERGPTRRATLNCSD